MMTTQFGFWVVILLPILLFMGLLCAWILKLQACLRAQKSAVDVLGEKWRDLESGLKELGGARYLLAEDPYLALPARAVDARSYLYQPTFTASRIRYVGNVLRPEFPGHLYVLKRLTELDHDVVFSEGPFIAAGDEFEILEHQLHDFRVGSTFVKVRRATDGAIGFLSMEAFVAETLPVTTPRLSSDHPLLAVVGDSNVLLTHRISPERARSSLNAFGEGQWRTAFSTELTKGTVHPVTAANQAFFVLAYVAPLGDEDPLRQESLAFMRAFFEDYVFPEAHRLAPGAVAWPNQYDFPIAWNITLKAPWYSAYSNGVMACSCALMYRMTGDERYAGLARDAVNWLKLPMEQGGGLYREHGFVFVAEYAYPSPPLPNIRVLDGEMLAVVSVFNVASLLKDASMMRFAAQLAYSLAAQLHLFTAQDGRIMNARYQWLVDNDGYLDPMKRSAVLLGMITKDQRFFDAAEHWKKSDTYWPY